MNQLCTKNLYSADYYENGISSGLSLYEDYRWMPELTIPMCAEICKVLGIERHDSLLDYGCAKGYMVKAFRYLGVWADGYDISEYAIDNADPDIYQYVFNELSNDVTYDWLISKDVLEHVDYSEIEEVLKMIRSLCHRAFIVVPLGDGKKYYVPEYEKDITHIIREDADWWMHSFESSGFDVWSVRYRMNFLKENWSQYKRANGFFELR